MQSLGVPVGVVFITPTMGAIIAACMSGSDSNGYTALGQGAFPKAPVHPLNLLDKLEEV